MKTIVILGSTGSIGTQTLDVIRKSGGYRVLALAAGRDAEKLEAQAREFLPRFVCLADRAAASLLRTRLADLPVTLLEGEEGLKEILLEQEAADIYAVSISGMIALKPVLYALSRGTRVALSNKESIVTAGHLMLPEAARCGAELIPVDSEHSAVFQCLQGEEKECVETLWITASGGPFRGRTLAELRDVTPEQALKHPNWSMGAKITVDSATLANKGLEVMEAHHLFGMPYEKIRVTVHPESVIHSMVAFADGAVKAQLGAPDMRLPIAYALGYPERGMRFSEPLDFTKASALHFEAPDLVNFPALALAYEAGRAGGTMPTVFNAANEWAVREFLSRRRSFTGIAEAIARAMAAHSVQKEPDLEAVMEAERETVAFLREKP